MNINLHTPVFDRYSFLRELGKETSATARKGIIEFMNVHRMEAVSSLIKYILRGAFTIRRTDYREFRQYVNALRHIVSPRVSLAKKRQTLMRFNRLIPRLLREEYLQKAIRVEFLPMQVSHAA